MVVKCIASPSVGHIAGEVILVLYHIILFDCTFRVENIHNTLD